MIWAFRPTLIFYQNYNKMSAKCRKYTELTSVSMSKSMSKQAAIYILYFKKYAIIIQNSVYLCERKISRKTV